MAWMHPGQPSKNSSESKHKTRISKIFCPASQATYLPCSQLLSPHQISDTPHHTLPQSESSQWMDEAHPDRLTDLTCGPGPSQLCRHHFPFFLPSVWSLPRCSGMPKKWLPPPLGHWDMISFWRHWVVLPQATFPPFQAFWDLPLANWIMRGFKGQLWYPTPRRLFNHLLNKMGTSNRVFLHNKMKHGKHKTNITKRSWNYRRFLRSGFVVQPLPSWRKAWLELSTWTSPKSSKK